MPIPLIIPLMISLISSVASLYAQNQASRQQEAIYEMEARNAKTEGEVQQQAIQAQADIQSEVNRDKLSFVTNVLANRGIDSLSGSPLFNMTAEFADNLEDRNESFRQGEIAKIRGLNQGTVFDYQAKAEGRSRSLNLVAGGIGAVSSIASTAYTASPGSFLTTTAPVAV